MIVKAPTPSNEVERLRALHGYNILDTPPSAAFDRITRLIVDILDVPTGIISFIDSDRQWYKSKLGIDLDEVPRAFSFCQHALLGDDIMVVPDAKEDGRFSQHPAVTDHPSIRFYVSAPIRTPDGLPIGTICALDTQPRNLSPEKQQCFIDLAGLVMDQLEMTQAKEIAEQSNNAKNKFISVMSHELRTPLNAIIGFSEMIEKEVLGRVGNSKYLEYAEHVKVSGYHLLSLINDVLDLSKIETGKFELDFVEINIASALDDAIHYIVARDGQASAREISYEIEKGLDTITADIRALRQILINILSNADKFSAVDQPIRIAVVRDPAAEATVIRIEDSGCGIATEDLERVLEPFGQSHSTPELPRQGTGLGLPISKNLMEMHNGSLTINNRPDQGVIVTLSFPYVSNAG